MFQKKMIINEDGNNVGMNAKQLLRIDTFTLDWGEENVNQKTKNLLRGSKNIQEDQTMI